MNRRKWKRVRVKPHQEVLRGLFLTGNKLKRKGEQICWLKGRFVILTEKRTPHITRITHRDWFLLTSRSKWRVFA